jgi:hypothetical protein
MKLYSKAAALVLGALVFAPMTAFAQQGNVTVTDCGSNRIPGAEEVLVFEHHYFQGRCWRIQINDNTNFGSIPNVGSTSPVAIWNDQVTSVLLGSFVRQFELYIHDQFNSFFGLVRGPGGTCAQFNVPDSQQQIHQFYGDANVGVHEQDNPSCVAGGNDALSSAAIVLAE